MKASERMITRKPGKQHNIHALIIDMDGVLWRGEQSIGDLPAIFDEIERKDFKFILASNNATGTVDQYVDKLRTFGVKIQIDQVINSGQATAHFLSRQFPQGGPVFMIGEEGLERALAECNFFHAAEESLAVVVALDRQLTYDQLRQATLLIRAGTPFIGTNPDRTLPSPNGLLPGTNPDRTLPSPNEEEKRRVVEHFLTHAFTRHRCDPRCTRSSHGCQTDHYWQATARNVPRCARTPGHFD